jgi:hypothetical protein
MLSVSDVNGAGPPPLSAPPPFDPGEDFRHDMIVWAEPVIADRIAEAYEARGLGSAYRSLLTTHHRRFWRALILQRWQQVESIRRELLADAARAGLDSMHLEAIDHEIIEELMDIVLKRFRSSRDSAKGFGLVLLGVAASLGEGRRHAA